ncbi:multicopper oxidase domain-containing protein [Solihabitans fulvus]|uniref:Multicopper oxidase domain-containing protein n=1 Tax=Solihabitans fulvus TaxID=1892852 RepID=A0A5B2X0U7_9PSEU|nr:multicopper oxidase domain-containing protein [Solihabitans fulvus]KAA2256546.1 multicopper oxidase domain-containing protein [Solihabitans fulvus]
MTEIADPVPVVHPASQTPTQSRFGLTLFRDPLRIPPVLRPRSRGGVGELVVRMSAARVRLHSELPETTVWGYGGRFPGPTIEVRRGERLRVSWVNALRGGYPVLSVVGTTTPPADPAEASLPGYDRARYRASDAVSMLPPWTVTRLHGADTPCPRGNAVLPGDSQLAEYTNDQPAAAQWYHDHAMAITRWNMTSGLLGLYLIRDDEEDALELPSGRREVPLIICDRNLDTDAEGRLTGRLLHKVEAAGPTDHGTSVGTRPFAGPFTLVNGGIWPHMVVEPRWYRFRVLNASNARTYRLALTHRDESGVRRVPEAAVRLIGTDAGLLGAPVPVGDDLVLAPGERADLLVDFGAFRGDSLRLLDTSQDAPLGEPDPAASLVEPAVMEFRVNRHQGWGRFELPAVLSPGYRRLDRESLPAGHRRRLVALVPPGTTGRPEMWELEPAGPGEAGVLTLRRADGRPVLYRRLSRGPGDPVAFRVAHGSWEVWDFVNLGGPGRQPTFPVHIHPVRFQILGRARCLVDGATATWAADCALSAHEQGWKDVVRVGPGELVSVAAQFTGGTGQFGYHCQILEYQDTMSRPFAVVPRQILQAL